VRRTGRRNANHFGRCGCNLQARRNDAMLPGRAVDTRMPDNMPPSVGTHKRYRLPRRRCRTWRLVLTPKMLKEWAAALFETGVAVKPFGQPVDPFAQLLRGHAVWSEVNVEQRAQVPASGFQDAVLLEQSVVERRAREGRQNRDLYVVKRHAQREVENLLED